MGAFLSSDLLSGRAPKPLIRIKSPQLYQLS